MERPNRPHFAPNAEGKLHWNFYKANGALLRRACVTDTPYARHLLQDLVRKGEVSEGDALKIYGDIEEAHAVDFRSPIPKVLILKIKDGPFGEEAEIPLPV